MATKLSRIVPSSPLATAVLLVAIVGVVLSIFMWLRRDEMEPIYVRPHVSPVSGTVTYGGEPLTDADMSLMPIGDTVGEPAPMGTTDKNGCYSLRFFSDGEWLDGAMPGTYAVRFSRLVRGDGTVFRPENHEESYEGLLDFRESLPMEYSLRSDLTMEISRDKQNGYDFALEKEE